MACVLLGRREQTLYSPQVRLWQQIEETLASKLGSVKQWGFGGYWQLQVCGYLQEQGWCTLSCFCNDAWNLPAQLTGSSAGQSPLSTSSVTLHIIPLLIRKSCMFQELPGTSEFASWLNLISSLYFLRITEPLSRMECFSFNLGWRLYNCYTTLKNLLVDLCLSWSLFKVYGNKSRGQGRNCLGSFFTPGERPGGLALQQQ